MYICLRICFVGCKQWWQESQTTGSIYRICFAGAPGINWFLCVTCFHFVILRLHTDLFGFLSCSPGLLLQKIFLVIPRTRILRRYFQLLAGMVTVTWQHFYLFLTRIIEKVIFCHGPVWFRSELAILRLQMALVLQLIDLPS